MTGSITLLTRYYGNWPPAVRACALSSFETALPKVACPPAEVPLARLAGAGSPSSSLCLWRSSHPTGQPCTVPHSLEKQLGSTLAALYLHPPSRLPTPEGMLPVHLLYFVDGVRCGKRPTQGEITRLPGWSRTARFFPVRIALWASVRLLCDDLGYLQWARYDGWGAGPATQQLPGV